MTTPLAHHRPDNPTVDRLGVEFADYVRVVTFPDRDPARPAEAPVHVLTAPVLFDGVMAPARIAKDGITVDLGRGGTVVTMQVHRDDVQIGNLSDDGDFTPWLIGGRRVVTSISNGWRWEPVDPDDPDNEYIVCSFHVAEVHVR